MIKNNQGYQIIIISLALAGAITLFLFLYYPGICVNPDSVYYFSVARNIYIGQGLTGYDGYPLILQPPLYPFLLLLVKTITRLSFFTSAGILNVLFFGSTIYLSGLILRKHLHSIVMVIAGILLIITSSILLKVFLIALSEPLFIFLSLLFLYLIEEYIKKNSLTILLFLSLTTAAAIMTRYIGIIIAAAGIVSILTDKKFSKKKFYHTIIYSLISLLPVLLWITRNYIISNSLTGSRASSSFSITQNLYLTYNTMKEWFLPPEYYNWYLVPAGLVLAVFFIYIFLKNKKNQSRQEFKFQYSLIIYISIYICTLMITSSMYAYDKIGDRLLSPVYIPITILLISVADRMLFRFNTSSGFNIIKGLTAALLLLFLNFSIQKSYFLIDDFKNNSSWEYSSKIWEKNNVIQFLEKMNKSNCLLYSNAPDAVYFFTKSETRWSPLKTYYNSNIRVNKKQSFYEVKQKGKKYLIWFNNVRRSFLYSKNELNTIVHLKKITQLKDGEVFEME